MGHHLGLEVVGPQHRQGARHARSRHDGDLSEIEFTFAVARPSGVETFTEEEALSCSLENPESCEACQ